MKRRIFLYATLLLFAACSGETQLFKNGSDIGDCKLQGSFVYDKEKDVYTLSGSGYDLWFEHDEFFMVWQEVTGDFKLSAKVAFEGEGVHQLRKMGLIIRESLDNDSKHANIALHGNALASLQYRREKGGESAEIRSANIQREYPIFHEESHDESDESHSPVIEEVKVEMPDHLILERVGNKILMRTGIGSYSDQPDATVELDLPQKCYVGLFICSHEVDVLETGYFSEVRLEK